jgi:nitroreductase
MVFGKVMRDDAKPEDILEKKTMDEWQKIWSPLVELRNEREDGIRHMFYEWDNEMKIMQKIQKCQRVWDHSKHMMDEVRDYLLWTAQNAPSKQHEAYYEIYWTCDRDVLDKLSKYTWGCTHNRMPPSTWQNSQMNANMYIVFVAKEPDTQLNANADGTLKGNEVAARWENAYVSIGIAMGLVMRAAASIGFSTGCNKSHNDLDGDYFWEKSLGILDDVIAGKKKITYGIGIGFPKEGVERWESDQTELAIGAANGSNLTTTDMDKNPRTGKPFRKIKIVDITKHAGETIQCPNGDWHIIPEKADIKINTMRVRHIDCTEIKMK